MMFDCSNGVFVFRLQVCMTLANDKIFHRGVALVRRRYFYYFIFIVIVLIF
jgi:hypothetical protein